MCGDGCGRQAPLATALKIILCPVAFPCSAQPPCSSLGVRDNGCGLADKHARG